MDQTVKLKSALKAEIRKTIKEAQSSLNNSELKVGSKISLPIDTYEDYKGKKVTIISIDPYKDNSVEVEDNEGISWESDAESFGLHFKDGKLYKDTQINELARVANVIKIGNLKAAQAYAEANKGKWVSDMVKAVIDAGGDGITQPALASQIGKGLQQTINPKVRELIDAGVFTQGEAGPKIAQSKHEKPIKSIDPKSTKTNSLEDDEDIEIEDDFLKSDEDNEEDEEELAKKVIPNKNIQSDSKKLDQVLSDMKKLASDYKAAKGTDREKEIVSKLKDLNKEKIRLEKTVHKALGSEDDEILDNDENE